MHFIETSLLKAQLFVIFWVTYLLKPEALLERLTEEERAAKRELAHKNSKLLEIGVRVRACSVPPTPAIDTLPRMLKCRHLKQEIQITRRAILVADAALTMPELLDLLIESGDATRLIHQAPPENDDVSTPFAIAKGVHEINKVRAQLIKRR